MGRDADWGTVRSSAEWMIEGVVPQLGRLDKPHSPVGGIRKKSEIEIAVYSK